MEFKSKYVSKLPDENGYIQYTDVENDVWRQLYQRQMKIIQDRACDEFIQGIDKLGLKPDAIPQLPQVNAALKAATGWQVESVPALIPHEQFFQLLAERKFPAATFIRIPEELNYVQEPDIFHELFGHCPMLTEPVFADFVQLYGETVLQKDESCWPLLQRVFWFTVEFGLIETVAGLRAYGGGILSSIEETQYSIESDKAVRKPFDPIDAIRTPYRIDMLQPVYFVIKSYQELYDFIRSDVAELIDKAHQLGEHTPLFPVEDSPSVHIHHC